MHDTGKSEVSVHRNARTAVLLPGNAVLSGCSQQATSAVQTGKAAPEIGMQ